MLAGRAHIIVVFVICIVISGAGSAFAHRPLVKTGHAGAFVAPYTSEPGDKSGLWTPLRSAFPGARPDTALLLTDGTVMMHDGCTPKWYRLTPSNSGDYAKGTWSELASMPTGYAPLYFGSGITNSGGQDSTPVVVVLGGEYNSSRCAKIVDTDKCEIYYIKLDEWNPCNGPETLGKKIGDAQTVLYENGVMFAIPSSAKFFFWNLTLGWNQYAYSEILKPDINDEEGWTELPGGNLVKVDVNLNDHNPYNNSEIFYYSPNEANVPGGWGEGPNTANILVDPIAHEIGPAVLMPTGHVFQAGANSCGEMQCVGHTGIYQPENNKWIAGPDFPEISGGFYDVSDGPAALLPSGRVLVQTSPNYGTNYLSPSHFFEFDEESGTLARVNEPASAPNVASFQGRMLVLPTGQVLWSSDQGDVEVYTSFGHAKSTWLPTITGISATQLVRGQMYTVGGMLLSGLSQGAAYGDDAQMATNYGLVRIINQQTSHVCYASTVFLRLAVGPIDNDNFQFILPAAVPPKGILPCEPGPSSLQVVADGLASSAINVTVQ